MRYSAGHAASAQLQRLKELRAGLLQIGIPAGRLTFPDHPVFWAGFP